MSPIVAHHDFLLNFVAAVSHGPQQGRCCMDALVCLQSLTVEQAVLVVALVRLLLMYKSCFFRRSSLVVRSISVDVQYFVVAVIAVFACSFVPSRAAISLTALTVAAVATSVTLSIQTAAELINAPAGSELRVPMPVIGIDWMQVLHPAASPFFFVSCIYFHFIYAGGCHERSS